MFCSWIAVCVMSEVENEALSGAMCLEEQFCLYVATNS